MREDPPDVSDNASEIKDSFNANLLFYDCLPIYAITESNPTRENKQATYGHFISEIRQLTII